VQSTKLYRLTYEGYAKSLTLRRRPLLYTYPHCSHRPFVNTSMAQDRQHKDGSGALYQLELENQRLRQSVVELEENEQELVSELEMISEERSEFEKINEDLTAKCDVLQNSLDQKTNRVAEVERDYEELSLKVEAENDAQAEWETKTQKKAESHRKERAKVRRAPEQQTRATLTLIAPPPRLRLLPLAHTNPAAP